MHQFISILNITQSLPNKSQLKLYDFLNLFEHIAGKRFNENKLLQKTKAK